MSRQIRIKLKSGGAEVFLLSKFEIKFGLEGIEIRDGIGIGITEQFHYEEIEGIEIENWEDFSIDKKILCLSR